MHKLIVIFSACFLIMTPAFALANDKSAKIDQLMQRYHDLGQFNGVALVIDGGATVLRSGYGFANREWQIENTPQTRFLVGSVTKSFTALAVAQLVDQGELNLDATIADYLPDYRGDTGSKVTLRQLLTHTDGIPGYTGDTYFWQSYENGVPYSTAEFIERYCSDDLAFEPGSQYRYGNAGYSILGAIIEQVTNENYGDTVARQILQPLGMRNSGQARSDVILDNRANGYESSIDGFRHAAPIYKPFFAAGSMYTTVDDLALYDRALYDDEVISGESKALLFESRGGAVDGTFAYGWYVDELQADGAEASSRYIATNGEVNGFNAVVVRLPDDERLIVLLNNTGETELNAMASNIIRILQDLQPVAPEPRVRDSFYRMLREESLVVAIDYYREQREQQPDDYLFFRWPLRILAGQLMTDGRYDDAIAILQLNLETNRNDVRSITGLADAHLRKGDKKTAAENYRKVLELDGANKYAANMLRELTD